MFFILKWKNKKVALKVTSFLLKTVSGKIYFCLFGSAFYNIKFQAENYPQFSFLFRWSSISNLKTLVSPIKTLYFIPEQSCKICSKFFLCQILSTLLRVSHLGRLVRACMKIAKSAFFGQNSWEGAWGR